MCISSRARFETWTFDPHLCPAYDIKGCQKVKGLGLVQCFLHVFEEWISVWLPNLRENAAQNEKRSVPKGMGRDG